MICLSITNSSELVASKVGSLIENLTPEKIDQTIVQNKVLGEILENLSNEGIQGTISIVNGIDVKKDKIILHNGSSIMYQKKF